MANLYLKTLVLSVVSGAFAGALITPILFVKYSEKDDDFFDYTNMMMTNTAMGALAGPFWPVFIFGIPTYCAADYYRRKYRK